MSNGARHAWGVLVGVVLIAALAGLLVYGTYRLQNGYIHRLDKQDKLVGGGLLAAAAVAFALLASSRLSPVAALIGGLVFTAAGVLFFASESTAADLINKVPFKAQRPSVTALEQTGVVLFAGVALLFSSLFPSRWRPAEVDDIGYEYDRPDQPQASFMQGGGRHAAQPERPASEGAGATATYDTPLYEPPRGQDSGRPPFGPS